MIPDWIENASYIAVFGTMMAIAIILTVISCMISIRIMGQKDIRFEIKKGAVIYSLFLNRNKTNAMFLSIIIQQVQMYNEHTL